MYEVSDEWFWCCETDLTAHLKSQLVFKEFQLWAGSLCLLIHF